MSLSGLSNEKKVQALTLCFTHKTFSIVHNLGLYNAEKKGVGTIIATIKKYINGHINESVECQHFRRRGLESDSRCLLQHALAKWPSLPQMLQGRLNAGHRA